MRVLAVSLVVFLSSVARAEGPDIASLYEVTTDGTSASFKAGQKGKLVLEVKTKEGAHISDEAPLTLELKGKDVAPEKAKLTLADSVGKKKGGSKFADPKFEVALSGAAPAKGQLDAKLVFFVCTEKLCSRQQKNLALPIEVQ